MSSNSSNSVDLTKDNRNVSDHYREDDGQIIVNVNGNKNGEKELVIVARCDRFGKEIRRGSK